MSKWAKGSDCPFGPKCQSVENDVRHKRASGLHCLHGLHVSKSDGAIACIGSGRNSHHIPPMSSFPCKELFDLRGFRASFKGKASQCLNWSHPGWNALKHYCPDAWLNQSCGQTCQPTQVQNVTLLHGFVNVSNFLPNVAAAMLSQLRVIQGLVQGSSLVLGCFRVDWSDQADQG